RERGVVDGHLIGPAAACQGLYADLDAARSHLGDVSAQLRDDVLRVLAHDQAAGDLGLGLARQHRLDARALEAAAHAVDLERRPHVAALASGELGYPPPLVEPESTQLGSLVVWLP